MPCTLMWGRKAFLPGLTQEVKFDLSPEVCRRRKQYFRQCSDRAVGRPYVKDIMAHSRHRNKVSVAKPQGVRRRVAGRIDKVSDHP